MRIHFLFVLAILFPTTSWATQDYTLNVKNLQVEGVNGEMFEIFTNKEGSAIERIDVALPIGKFSIPSKYLKDVKAPDLTSLSIMFNPGGARVEIGEVGKDRGRHWGPYYVVKFHFYGDGSEQYYVEDAAPELEIVFRDAEEPKVNLIKNYACPPPHMTDFGCSSRSAIIVSGTRILKK